MTRIIEQIVRDKPHLADPFRFYGRVLEFIEAVRRLHFNVSAADTCYPQAMVPDVFTRFTALLDLPEGTLAPLKQALEAREIDFTRLPFNEVPAFSLPYAEEELAMMLSLFSRPWFLALGETRGLGGRSWDEGKCPVCSAQPVVCWTSEGQRQASCSFCGTRGIVAGTGCPVCLGGEKQQLLRFEGEDSFTINTCGLCRSYVKLVDPVALNRWSPDIADLISLPLDMIVQEKGFQRRVPNPLGMLRMSVRG